MWKQPACGLSIERTSLVLFFDEPAKLPGKIGTPSAVGNDETAKCCQRVIAWQEDRFHANTMPHLSFSATYFAPDLISKCENHLPDLPAKSSCCGWACQFCPGIGPMGREGLGRHVKLGINGNRRVLHIDFDKNVRCNGPDAIGATTISPVWVS